VTIFELIELLTAVQSAHGNLQVKISGDPIEHTEVVPGIAMFKPYFDITGK